MTLASRAAAVAFASLFLMGTAFAQTPAPAPAAPAAKPAPMAKTTEPKAKPEMTAESKECSAQADAKGLHGKERKKFRSECKHDAKAKK
jgi:psiF repeat-containing protein